MDQEKKYYQAQKARNRQRYKTDDEWREEKLANNREYYHRVLKNDLAYKQRRKQYYQNNKDKWNLTTINKEQ